MREADGARSALMSCAEIYSTAPPHTANVRDLARWRSRIEDPVDRAQIPLIAFCEFTPDRIDLDDGKPALKGEVWFEVAGKEVSLIAGVWRKIGDKRYFACCPARPTTWWRRCIRRR